MRWYIGAALLLLAALVMQSGLLAYSMYVLLAVLIITRLLARSWINNLSATRAVTGPEGKSRPNNPSTLAEIGDKATVTVTIRNAGHLPVPWVLLEDLLPREALTQRPPRFEIKGKRLQIKTLGAGKEITLKYQLTARMRGYYQIGPLVMETGDLFGLHRRYCVDAEPHYLLVYPRTVPLEGYDLASRRPIGDVRLVHRLYEDPTRIVGIRPYEAGDPLNRVHWRATARTGQLHSKIYEPSTLAGATLVVDFHAAGYHRRGEPFRSDLAVTAAASLANAVYQMGQQVGLVTNGRDAAERVRLEGWKGDHRTRQAARQTASMVDQIERLQPVVVETRRGAEQLLRIRETLARIELTDGLTLAELVVETSNRMPRDATVVAVLPNVPVETALALGTLRRLGFAVTAILVMLDVEPFEKGFGRLRAEGITDIRNLRDETGLVALCQQQALRTGPPAPESDIPSLPSKGPPPDWTEQTPYEFEQLDLA